MVNLAINGIGRIGKLALRLLISKNYNVKYLNELNGNTSSLIHSIEFDSIHGKWQTNLEEGENEITIEGNISYSIILVFSLWPLTT